MSQYSEWFKQLQDDIVATVESLDSTMEERVAPTREGWTQSHKTIKSTVFEKGTVNFSEVTGEFDAKFAKGVRAPNQFKNKISLSRPHRPIIHTVQCQ